VNKMFIPHPVAIEQMKRGEIAGVVFITSSDRRVPEGQMGTWIQVPARQL